MIDDVSMGLEVAADRLGKTYRSAQDAVRRASEVAANVGDPG